jgi:hypothetical protein
MRDILKLIPKDHYIDGLIITRSTSVDPKHYYWVQIQITHNDYHKGGYGDFRKDFMTFYIDEKGPMFDD